SLFFMVANNNAVSPNGIGASSVYAVFTLGPKFLTVAEIGFLIEFIAILQPSIPITALFFTFLKVLGLSSMNFSKAAIASSYCASILSICASLNLASGYNSDANAYA